MKAPPPPMLQRTAWVVDDDRAIQLMIKRLLADGGIDAIGFDDAEQVLDHVDRAAVPDLVVADIMMPGVSGFALVRALRARPPFAHIPIIVATARAEVGDAVLAARYGATLLRKPFRLRELAVTVERLIELSRPLPAFPSSTPR